MENEWIFGYGLRPQFLHLVQERPNLGGSDITRTGGQEGDYLLATDANVSFTLLVEIKRPDAQLVTTTPYRNRVYGLGDDLVWGIAQLQQQCWRWGSHSSRFVENQDRLEGQNIYTHEPRGLLVIGNTSSLDGSREKLQTFEGFRRNLWQPEVITYDELLRRTEFTVNAQLRVEDEGEGS